MSESIHGHQLIEMLASSKTALSRDSLLSEIETKFGENPRFHTCMDSDLTGDDLINFLITKGKFIENEQGLLSSTGAC